MSDSKRHLEIHLFIGDGQMGWDIGDVDTNQRLSTASYTDQIEGWQALQAKICAWMPNIATTALPRPALCEAMVLVEETLTIKDCLGYPAWNTEKDYETIDRLEDEYHEWDDTEKGSDHEALELRDLIARSVMRLARLGKVGYHDGRGRAKVASDGA